MPFCDQCGERISEQARFCPNCGARRWSPEGAAPEEPPPPEAAAPKAPPPPEDAPDEPVREEPPPEAPRATRPEEELYAVLGAQLRTPPVSSARPA
jgi:zinc-ribbon domain